MRRVYSAFLLTIMIALGGCTGASTENPTISLKGQTDIQLNLGEYSIAEEGFVANDVKDGDITNSVQKTHNINFYQPGTYTITYSVMDSDGYTAEAIRRVTIYDTYDGYYNNGQQYVGSIPVITFSDGDTVYLALGQAFDGAYSAYDLEDGDLGYAVNVQGTDFDVNQAGIHTVIYSVADSNGNYVEKRRTIFVGDYGSSETNWNGVTNQDIDDFEYWYSTECGKTFDRTLYNANTGFYDGEISCSYRNFYSIDLTNMKIFSTIRSVDFSHNNLSDIDLSPFYSTNVIEKVDLSYNDFSYIDFRPLYNLKNINELWINNNNLNYTEAERIEIYEGFNNRSFDIKF